MKAIIAIFLLFSIVFLSMPKQIFHDHGDHQLEHVEDHSNGSEMDDESCSFCDFDFSLFALTLPEFDSNNDELCSDLPLGQGSRFENTLFLSKPKRGPPCA